MSSEDDHDEVYIEGKEVENLDELVPEPSDEDIDEGPIEGHEEEMVIDYQDDSIQAFSLHQNPVYAVNAHPTMPLCISGGGDDRAYLWNFQTGESFGPTAGLSLNDSVNAVAFSFDGLYFAAGSLGGALIVGDSATGQVLHHLETCEITWIKWHPFGPVLLVGGEDGTAWLFSMPSGRCLQVFSFSESPITCAAFTTDGKRVITASEDATLCIWDPKSASLLNKYFGFEKDTRFHQASIFAVTCSSDSQLIITGANDGSIRVTLASSIKIVASLDAHMDSIESLLISPKNSNLLISASLDCRLNIWDLTSFKLIHTCITEIGITKAIFLKDSHLVVSAHTDGHCSIWDSRTAQLVSQRKGHLDVVLDLAAIDHQTFVSASDDGTCLVFSVNES